MLTRLQKIYFGMARLGPSMMLDTLSLATALFYYSLNDLPGIYTGISLAISYLVIAFVQFLFGYLSDKTSSERFGRRKPFVIIGAPLMALSFLFIFTPHWFVSPTDTFGLFIYATTTLSMFKVFYGMVTTPFQSWMPEITEPEERPAVSSWQNVANFLAFVTSILVTILLAGLSVGWGLHPLILDIILVMIVLEVIGFIPPVVGIHKEGRFIPNPSITKELGIALTNHDFVGWLVAQGLLSIGFAMVSSMAFPYVNDYLAFGLTDIILFGVELLVVVFSFFLVWMWGIRRFGKRRTLQAAMTLTVVVLPFTMFITAKVLGFLLIALLAAGVAGYFLFPYIVYADFAHKDELLTGEGRAGVYTGFPAIPLNICQALSALLMGYILDLPRILEVPGHPGKFVTLGYHLWGPVSAIFILLAVLVLFKVDLDPDFERLASESKAEPIDATLGEIADSEEEEATTLDNS